MHIRKFESLVSCVVHSFFCRLVILPDCFVLLQLLLPRLADIGGVRVLGHRRLVRSEPPLWSSTNCISSEQGLLNNWRDEYIYPSHADSHK